MSDDSFQALRHVGGRKPMRAFRLLLYVLLLGGCSEPVTPPASRSARDSPKNSVAESRRYDYQPIENILNAYPKWNAESLPKGDQKYHHIGPPIQANEGNGFHGDAVEWNGHRIECQYPGVPEHELLVLFLVGDDGREGFAILKRKVVGD